jgi:RNA polymerase sigma-70 factor (ECF subfamily)
LYAPLWRYFLVRGLDSFTSEELVHDVLLTLYRRSTEIRNSLCIMGWLYQVARNAFLQHVRKRGIPAESLSGKVGEKMTPAQSMARFRTPQDSELFDWILVLEEDEREICLMRYLDGLDYQSIADALEMPMGTVKWKLHQIKKKIGVRLQIGTTGRQ